MPAPHSKYRRAGPAQIGQRRHPARLHTIATERGHACHVHYINCATATLLTPISGALAPSPALYFMLDVGDTAGLVLTLCLLVLNGAILAAFAAVLVREYLAGAMAGWDADGDGVLTAQDVAMVGFGWWVSHAWVRGRACVAERKLARWKLREHQPACSEDTGCAPAADPYLQRHCIPWVLLLVVPHSPSSGGGVAGGGTACLCLLRYGSCPPQPRCGGVL